MLSALVFATFWMGLVGGPHCVIMCSAACAGMAQTGFKWSLLQFHLGRVLGYALLGVLAAASMHGLGWLTVQSSALRPVWSLVHVAAMMLGLVLFIYGRQPIWLEQSTRKIWARVQAWGLSVGRGKPFVLGVCWAFMPCGLLYSALMVAALAPDYWHGGFAMAAFALGTTLAMVLAPWLWLRVLKGKFVRGEWGVRLAGLVLSATAAGALWMGLAHQTAPWCVSP